MMKYRQATRTFLLLGVALATTLTLLIRAATFHLPGFSQISFAHAMEQKKATFQVQSLCASHPSAQNCTHQDPAIQGCEKDAHTIAFMRIIDETGKISATLERRYSPTCHSEWGRITDDGTQPLTIIMDNTVRSTKGRVAFSTMLFVADLSMAPQVEGIVSKNGINPLQAGGKGLTAILQALPPA